MFGFNKKKKETPKQESSIKILKPRDDNYKPSFNSNLQQQLRIAETNDNYLEKGYFEGIERLGAYESQLTTADAEISRWKNTYTQTTRTQYKQNPILKRSIDLLDTNVIGNNGFELQFLISKNGVINHELSKIIVNEFINWQKPENCDFHGRTDFKGICTKMLKDLEIDGEMLLNLVTEKRNKYNPYGFQLQELDTARLDVNHSGINERSNNEIKMAIEFNNRGRPVCYYVKKKTKDPYNYQYYNAQDFEVLDAENVIFKFYPTETEQTRSLPTSHAILDTLTSLVQMRRATLQNVKLSATACMVFEMPDGVDPEDMADEVDTEGNLIFKLQPGVAMMGPPGAKVSSFAPNFPSGVYVEYVKQCLKEIAGALGFSPMTLVADTDDINYSTGRLFSIEERNMFIKKQNFMIDNVLNKVFERWLESAILNGKIIYKGHAINTISDFGVIDYKFSGVRWSGVDPVKEINAKKTAFGLGVISLTDILAESGSDIYELKAKIDRDREVLGDELYWKIFNAANNIQGENATTIEE